MKTFFNIILASIILVSFSQCGNSKDLGGEFEKEMPIKIKEATYQSWVSGVERGGAGITIIITFENTYIKLNDVFEIDSIYFREQKMKPETRQNPFQIIGRYKSTTNQPKDIILHKEPVKEYGNKAPMAQSKTTFELESDEAIISYKQHGKTKHFKLKLAKKETSFYQ